MGTECFELLGQFQHALVGDLLRCCADKHSKETQTAACAAMEALARTMSVEILTVRDLDMLASYLQGLPQPVRGDATERIRAVRAGAPK